MERRQVTTVDSAISVLQVLLRKQLMAKACVMRCETGFTDNSSVNVVPTLDGKQLISMTESVAGTYRVDLDLKTLGQMKFQDGVKGLLTTAHPTLLPDGSMINLTSGVRWSFIQS